jgi:hypothetical protein
MRTRPKSNIGLQSSCRTISLGASQRRVAIIRRLIEFDLSLLGSDIARHAPVVLLLGRIPLSVLKSRRKRYDCRRSADDNFDRGVLSARTTAMLISLIRVRMSPLPRPKSPFR